MHNRQHDYGKNLQVLVVAFNTVGVVSENRIHEIICGVFKISLPTGTINNIVSSCAGKIKPRLIQYAGSCLKVR